VISLEPASRPEAIGLVFEGKLKVPAAGAYVFDVDATEGIRLIVAGQKVIDRPGRGTHRVEGTAKLEAGFAPVRVEYFNHDKKPRLQLGWRSDKMPRRSLSEVAGDVPGRAFLADSRAKGQVWSFVTKKPETGWEKPGFEDMDWRRGEGGFGQPGTPGAVVRTPWNSSDIWMRTKFRIDNAGRKAPKSLALSIHHDEDVDVYLNGHLVYSAKGFLTAYERRGLDVAALQYLCWPCIAVRPAAGSTSTSAWKTDARRRRSSTWSSGMARRRGAPSERSSTRRWSHSSTRCAKRRRPNRGSK
jgi:hypothetical protein